MSKIAIPSNNNHIKKWRELTHPHVFDLPSIQNLLREVVSGRLDEHNDLAERGDLDSVDLVIVEQNAQQTACRSGEGEREREEEGGRWEGGKGGRGGRRGTCIDYRIIKTEI